MTRALTKDQEAQARLVPRMCWAGYQVPTAGHGPVVLEAFAGMVVFRCARHGLVEWQQTRPLGEEVG